MCAKELILIPAFNEEGRIEKLVSRIKALHPAIDILVVNDFSTDLTHVSAKNSGAMVINHPFNMGYGSTLQTGYKFALENNYDFLVQLDGDGQHNPEFIAPLLEEIKSGKYDLCVGSRFIGKWPYNTTFPRKAGMILFGNLVSILIKKRITDPTSGFQSLNKKTIKFFTTEIFPSDYPDADVILLLNRKGFKTGEVPVMMYPSSEGQSMHSGLKPLYYIFKMFLSIFINLIRKT